MKSEKGVTLMSLIIYVIGLTIVIGVMSMFMNFFYANVKREAYADSTSEQYSSLIQYISKDMNSSDFRKITLVDNDNNNNTKDSIYISFNNSDIIHEYSYSNNSVFYMEGKYNDTSKKLEAIKTVSICKDVTSANFEIYDNILKVELTMNEKNYSNQFAIKNSNL